MENNGIKTSLDNKTFIRITDSGYMYSPDRKHKTLNLDTACEWWNCKKEDAVKVYGCTYYYTGFLIEPDEDTNQRRVKVSFWKIRNSRPTDPTPLEVELLTNKRGVNTDHYCYYIYANGMVSHNLEWNSDVNEEARINKENEIPHRIKKQACPCLNQWYDLPDRMVDMNSDELYKGYGKLCDKTIKILKDAGFPSQFQGSYGCCGIMYFSNLISYYEKPVGRKSSKAAMKVFDTLEGFPDSEIMCAEKFKDGVVIRVKNKEFNPSDRENARIYITSAGAITQHFLTEDMDLEGNITYSWRGKNARSTHWFRSFIASAYENKLLTDKHINKLKDLFKETIKFKYVNEWINEHMKTLLGVNEKGYSSCGLIEFLKDVNKYPTLIETMIKLGFDQELFLSKSYYNFDREIFGSIKDESELFACLGINKAQWKYMLSKAKSDTKKDQLNALHGLSYVKKYFLGEGAYGNTHYEYSSIAQIPLNQFSRFYDLWFEAAYNKEVQNLRGCYYYNDSNKYYYPSCLTDIYCSYDRPATVGDPNNDEMFKFYEYGIRHLDKRILSRYSYDPDIREFNDYVKMRSQCVGIEGFDLKDWPMIPEDKMVHALHDRLLMVYNASKNAIKEKQMEGIQKLYAKQLPELRKFTYEEDDDDKCIIVPEKLIELIFEGQKLVHCVGSYTGSVANGDETILFLRKKDSRDVSYATVDIIFNKDSKLWEVRQAHTKHNGDITDEDVSFLKRWGEKNKVDQSTIKNHYGWLVHR